MLPVDLVHARRQRDRLLVPPLGARTPRALDIARRVVAVAEAHVGRTRDELEQAWRSIDVEPKEVKLRDGLIALVEDAISLDARDDVDAPALRAEVFQEAARHRREGSGAFDREAVLSAVAARRGVTPERVEADLYADLRGAQVVKAPAQGTLVPGGAEAIVERYDLAQAQAVLLRATRVVVRFGSSSPLAVRDLVRKLKFHRLLFVVTRRAEGLEFAIDGPSALFEATTKYGLALALALPSILACGPTRLEAEVRWGKERTSLLYVVEPPSPLLSRRMPIEAAIGEEASTLLARLRERAEGFEVLVADTVLEVPGFGVVVPDITLRERVAGRRVHVELLGYWSRDAVFRRVEMVERGLPEPILFCASARLRVSEALVSEELGAALYVYKGAPSAAAILERAVRLLERAASPERQQR